MVDLLCPFSADDINKVIKNLLNNITSNTSVLTKITEDTVLEAMPGAVIASPSLPGIRFTQDYFFFWVRDGAIVMRTITELYLKCHDANQKSYYLQNMIDYVHFVEKIQAQPMQNGVNVLGEPKFNVDGTLWTGHWARPQNDGAAFQALALLEIITILIDENINGDLVAKIYNAAEPQSLLKANLEYCASVWQSKSINAWEELYGEHFSVRIVQRAALLKGAILATRLGDQGAAKYYTEQANHISTSLEQYWNSGLGYYSATINEQNQEGGGLTSGALIGLVYAQIDMLNDEFALATSKVLSTAFYTREKFVTLYQINVKNRLLGNYGPLIGRYSSDIYDGHYSIYGNPWFLCSNLLALVYYGAARQLLLGNEIIITFLMQQFLGQVAPALKFELNDVLNKKHPNFLKLMECLISEGDSILASIKKYCVIYDDGSALHMSEQIDRATGEPVSARDLSWSYSSLLSAVHERDAAMVLLSELLK